jgi:hypothetical protein
VTSRAVKDFALADDFQTLRVTRSDDCGDVFCQRIEQLKRNPRNQHTRLLDLLEDKSYKFDSLPKTCNIVENKVELSNLAIHQTLRVQRGELLSSRQFLQQLTSKVLRRSQSVNTTLLLPFHFPKGKIVPTMVSKKSSPQRNKATMLQMS